MAVLLLWGNNSGTTNLVVPAAVHAALVKALTAKFAVALQNVDLSGFFDSTIGVATWDIDLTKLPSITVG